MNKVTAVVVGLVVAAGGYWWLAVPHSYEDCVLDGLKDAKTEKAANIVQGVCRKKFRSYSHTASVDTTPAPVCTKDNPFYKYCAQD